MGALTRTQPVRCTGPARNRIVNWSLAGMIAVSALSSATAVAGLREYSPETAGSGVTVATTKELPPLTGSVDATVSSPGPNGKELSLLTNEGGTLFIDPLSVNPVSEELRGSDGLSPLRVNLHPPVLEVTPPAAKPEGGPLLIPLPTAVTAGMCGLLGLAVLLAPRRLRRRLLS